MARATEHSDGPDTLLWQTAGRRVTRFDNGRSENYSAVMCGDWDRIRVARDDVAGGPLAAHIARHDPARVLADVAAKRRIMDLHAIGHDPCDAHDASFESIPCDTMRLLALPYAEHESYRPEWAP